MTVVGPVMSFLFLSIRLQGEFVLLLYTFIFKLLLNHLLNSSSSPSSSSSTPKQIFYSELERVKLNIFRPLSFVETRFSSFLVNAEFRSIKKSYHFHSLKSESYLTRLFLLGYSSFCGNDLDESSKQ